MFSIEENGKSLLRIPLSHFGSDISSIFGMSLSPQGDLLATVHANEQLRVWNTSNWEEEANFKNPLAEKKLIDVAFFPDGRHLAAATQGRIIIWDLKEKEIERKLPTGCCEKDKSWYSGLSISPNGRYLAAAQSLRTHVWDLETGECARNLVHDSSAFCTHFSPDGSVLATVDMRDVTLWDPLEGSMIGDLFNFHGRINTVVFSPGDGQYLVGGTMFDYVVIWERKTLEPVKYVKTAQENVKTVAYAPDGSLLASGSEDGQLVLRDVSTLEPIWRGHLNAPITMLMFSPTADKLFIATWGGDLYILII